MQNLFEIASLVNVSPKIAHQANLAVESRQAVFTAWSGKICSGKDFISERVMREVAPEAKRIFFADGLKKEGAQIVQICQSHKRIDLAIKELKNTLKIYENEATYIAEHLFNYPNLAQLNILDRSDTSRHILQYFGTDVRRSKDPIYWVKQWWQAVLPLMAEGVSIYCTDCRFTDEADGAKALGFNTFRLEISEAEQNKRHILRTGRNLPLETKEHVSEISLDEYTNFDLKVLNEIPANETVATFVNYLQ